MVTSARGALKLHHGTATAMWSRASKVAAVKKSRTFSVCTKNEIVVVF